ncbi:MAG TPA: HAMP domain-containing protein [Dehalococcoidia bacterium]|nr:HAMP domain-containing protein [Dehalococcoidia bacterium]
MLAAVAAVTTLGARRILNPVAELTEAARRMERGSLDQRVAGDDDDELGRLGQAFNSTAEELQRSDTERRTLTSDIAHELRTPLSNIRGYLEGIEDGGVEPSDEVIATIHEEALLLQQLVDDLQTLTLAEGDNCGYIASRSISRRSHSRSSRDTARRQKAPACGSMCRRPQCPRSPSTRHACGRCWAT